MTKTKACEQLPVTSEKGTDRVPLPERTAIRITADFEARLSEIERYWIAAADRPAFERLIDALGSTVLPLLERAPQTGYRLLDPKLENADAPLAGEWLARAERAQGELRVHEFDDNAPGQYRLLYLFVDETVYLLSIRRVEARAGEGVARITTRSSSARHSAQSDRSPD